MLESFMQQFRRGTEQLQRRSEEVTHSARLRLEVYQLAREQDALYGRLGRAYCAGVDKATLEELRAEITQLEQEITGRETLMAEMGDDLSPAPTRTPPEADPPPRPVTAQPVRLTHPRWCEASATAHQTATVQQAAAASHPSEAATASRIWRAKERERQDESHGK